MSGVGMVLQHRSGHRPYTLSTAANAIVHREAPPGTEHRSRGLSDDRTPPDTILASVTITHAQVERTPHMNEKQRMSLRIQLMHLHG